MDVFVGFDSAWADNPRAPGAICALGLEAGRPALFEPPRLVGFDEALAFVAQVRSPDGVTLVALDQPTMVPNATGMRPAERVAASLIAWLGGGVQPANRGRIGLFCDAAPVWRFLTALGATDDPEAARGATRGLFVMEVFPALALASLDPDFLAPRGGPRYNPARRGTFRLEDWVRVAAAGAREARGFGCEALARWCEEAGAIAVPRKADQDRLDAALCALIALRWRLRARAESMRIGDLLSGYIVAPASPEARRRVSQAAGKCGVALDGIVPGEVSTCIA